MWKCGSVSSGIVYGPIQGFCEDNVGSLVSQRTGSLLTKGETI